MRRPRGLGCAPDAIDAVAILLSSRCGQSQRPRRTQELDDGLTRWSGSGSAVVLVAVPVEGMNVVGSRDNSREGQWGLQKAI